MEMGKEIAECKGRSKHAGGDCSGVAKAIRCSVLAGPFIFVFLPKHLPAVEFESVGFLSLAFLARV